MCANVRSEKETEAIGVFDKRGDGQVQHFPILVTLCQCGSTYWARIPNGVVWVKAEKEADIPNPEEAHKFSEEVAQCTGYGNS